MENETSDWEDELVREAEQGQDCRPRARHAADSPLSGRGACVPSFPASCPGRCSCQTLVSEQKADRAWSLGLGHCSEGHRCLEKQAHLWACRGPQGSLSPARAEPCPYMGRLIAAQNHC